MNYEKIELSQGQEYESEKTEEARPVASEKSAEIAAGSSAEDLKAKDEERLRILSQEIRDKEGGDNKFANLMTKIDSAVSLAEIYAILGSAAQENNGEVPLPSLGNGPREGKKYEMIASSIKNGDIPSELSAKVYEILVRGSERNELNEELERLGAYFENGGDRSSALAACARYVSEFANNKMQMGRFLSDTGNWSSVDYLIKNIESGNIDSIYDARIKSAVQEILNKSSK